MTTDPTPWPLLASLSRPLLGANGTEAMAILLARGGDPLVDYMKVGPFMGMPAVSVLAREYPLMLHLDDTLSGHKPLDDSRVNTLEDWVRLTGTPWTSEHLGFAVAETTLDESLQLQPSSSGLSREVAMANIARNARELRAALPVPLLLENVPLYPNIVHRHITEPAFIDDVLALAGCDLLLDLAHARVTASVLGMAAEAYLEALPLDRVREIHLSGPRPVDALSPSRQSLVRANARTVTGQIAFHDRCLIDAHEAMGETDYDLLAWALRRCRPLAVSLEYYRDAGRLSEQLSRLREIIAREGQRPETTFAMA
ncbi:MAG: DUF692 family protein [Anaerolineae bacterium]